MAEQSYEEMLKHLRERLPKTESQARFEMPRASIQQQGRQTFIKNFSEIAKTLRREPQHLAKFFFKELAVPGSIAGDQLLLQGKISTDMVNRRLDDYVKEFVLCNECKKPDTNLTKVDKITTLKCEACGAKRPVRSI